MMSPEEILKELKKLDKRRSLMIEYLKSKLDEEDFHGVEDAYNNVLD